MEKEVVVFSVDVDRETADKFDAIAKKVLRSRAGHLRFLIEKEIEDNYEKISGREDE